VRSKAEVVIHPVRLRIAGALLAQPMNTQQIAGALPDVPPATLYRHVRALATFGTIEVVSRRTINGIVEPTYAVRQGAARFGPKEFAAIPASDHARYLSVVFGAQMAVAQAYFREPGHHVVRDGATYFRADLNLTDTEARQLRARLLALMRRYRRPAGRRRRVRHVAVSLIPAGRSEKGTK
jgi:hypothetical protein